MKLAPVLAVSVTAVCLQFRLAWADEHEHRGEEHRAEEHRGEEHRAEEHREMRHDEHRTPPPRPEPPRYQPHPRGIHPRGATVHPHAIRVMRPHIAKYGVHPWHHWAHPEFVRPIYYWDWPRIRQVTCVAEDSYGDQYPVTEETFKGFGLINMSQVEDDALDRCYEESGNDASCFIATCSHF